MTLPALPGSGGGGSSSSVTGGIGGGVIQINATNITVDGTLSAKGGVGATAWTGGGGGSIYLNASGTLSGGGMINAEGGSPTSTAGGGPLAADRARALKVIDIDRCRARWHGKPADECKQSTTRIL